MATSIAIRRADCFHSHFRDGALMKCVVQLTAASFARALAMPNLATPLTDADAIKRYADDVRTAAPSFFTPLFSLYLTPTTSMETIWSSEKAGAIAAKLYIRGATTNSSHGVPLEELHALRPVFHAMEESGMTLCIHGEVPDAYVLDREAEFLPTLRQLSCDHPGLRIVLEHISDRRSVKAVRRLPNNVAVTITIHHLLLTTDDVIGGSIRPHHHCMPCAKRPEDRDALREAATSGDPKFFLGTDSAPHPRGMKECATGCAGVFTAPVAMPLLADLFESLGQMKRIEDFSSRFGAEHYRLPLDMRTITLTKQPWVVPTEYHGIVPFYAGQTLNWQVGTMR